MGSSGWSYFTPYQANITEALAELQRTVFESGDYNNREAERIQEMNRDPEKIVQYFNKEKDFHHAYDYNFPYTSAEEWVEELRQNSSTIEGLRLLDGEEGTHTIIDIDHVAGSPESMAVSPLSPDELIRLFGTKNPTHEAVEAAKDELTSYLHGWSGVFVIVYQNDMPTEIFFAGYSGD